MGRRYEIKRKVKGYDFIDVIYKRVGRRFMYRIKAWVRTPIII